MSNRRLARVLICVPVVCASVARAGVITVGPSGADHSSIQPAINAAVDGDVVLVRPSASGYSGGFIIDGKGISVVADGPNVRVGGAWSVRNVTAAQTALVAGFVSDASMPAGLVVENCVGPVRVEDVVQHAFIFPTLGSRISGSSNVALARCSLTGPSGSHPFESGYVALGVGSSSVALYDVTLRGGNGTGGSATIGGSGGGPALSASQSVLFASHAVLLGGNGGHGGCNSCGVTGGCPSGGGGGGAALVLNGPMPGTATLLDCTLTSGTSGSPGCGFPAQPPPPPVSAPSGSVTQLAGAHRVLTCAPLAREGATAALTFRGQPGDRVLLVLSAGARWEPYPAFQGVILYGNASRRFLMGFVPGTGVLDVALPIPELGPGVEHRTRHLQGLFIDTSNVVTLGSPVALTMLDGAF